MHRVFLAVLRLLPSEAWPERKEVAMGVSIRAVCSAQATNERRHETATQGPWVGTLHEPQ